MPLREAPPVSFRFGQGIETKADPKTVPVARPLVLENGVFTRGISIKKRNGYEDTGQAIDGSVSTVTDAIRMAARGDELLEFTANRGYSRQTGTEQWSDTGAVFSAVGADRPLVATGTDQTQPDLATAGGVTVAAWEDSNGGVWWSAIDATTGRVYRAATQAHATGISPRCVAVGGNLHVYFAVTATTSLYVLVVNPSSPGSAVTASVLTGDLDATDPVYDACATARAGQPAAIAWFESGTTSIRIGYVAASGVLGTPLSGEPSIITYAAARLAGSPIALSFGDVDAANADRIAMAYVQAGPLGRTVFLSGGNGNTTAITALNAATAYTPISVTRVALALILSGTTQRAWSAWEESAAAASKRFIVTTSMEVTAGASAVTSTQRSVGLAAGGFAIGTDAFVTVVHDTTYFNTYFTLKISDTATDGFVPVGRHVPAAAHGAPARQHLPSPHVDGSVVTIALSVKQRLISENNDKFTESSIRAIEMDFDNDDSHQAAMFGAGIYLAGACPMHYDGRVWTELGIHVGPELIATVTAAGGSMTPATSYLYRSWYEWPDAQGEIHRGPVSNGTLITMGGADTQVTLTLPTLRITRKSGVRIMLARSQAAATGNTSQLFRVTSLDPTTAGGVNGYIANDTTVDTVTFVDRMSDSTLTTFDEIYTEGGIFSNDPAPLGSALARGKDRLFSSDASDGSVVRYSQPITAGYGVEWPPDLFLRVDPPLGDVTAIASRDDRLIVWTDRAIYTFAGDGPNVDGSTSDLGSGFSRVQTVPTDVGCTEPASVVLTPNGYMFKSAKGYYLLGNDFSVAYVGSKVEAFNAQTVRRATLLPDRTQVVILTDSGSTLLYDHLFNEWSTFTNHEGHDSAVVSNQYYYLRTDGRVFRETVGEYSDAGVRIRLRLETAWIHMVEHLSGFQKFWNFHLLGTWSSAHQLGVQYQTDYTHGWTDAVWFDATGESSGTGWISGSNVVGVEPISGSDYGDGEYGDGSYGGTSPGEYAWRLDLYETGQSIQFRFEDFEADGFAGPSFELTELVVTGAVIGSVRRPMTTARSA